MRLAVTIQRDRELLIALPAFRERRPEIAVDVFLGTPGIRGRRIDRIPDPGITGAVAVVPRDMDVVGPINRRRHTPRIGGFV